MKNEGLSPERIIKNNIRQARLATGLSQEAFASKVKISKPSYVAIEWGKTKVINDKIPLIAQTCGISVPELLLGRKAVEDTDPMLREEILSRDETIAALKADYEARLAEKQEFIRNQAETIKSLQNNISVLLSREGKD